MKDAMSMFGQAVAKAIIPIVITAVIAGGIGFWIGKGYGAASVPAAGGYAAQGGTRGGGTGGGMGRRGGAGFIGGSVLSKDAQSITVSVQGGGTKIIFFSDTTKFSKSVDGTIDDVQVGSQVIANGTPNQDGSVTASLIQLRPAAPAGQGGSAAPQGAASGATMSGGQNAGGPGAAVTQ